MATVCWDCSVLWVQDIDCMGMWGQLKTDTDRKQGCAYFLHFRHPCSALYTYSGTLTTTLSALPPPSRCCLPQLRPRPMGSHLVTGLPPHKLLVDKCVQLLASADTLPLSAPCCPGLTEHKLSWAERLEAAVTVWCFKIDHLLCFMQVVKELFRFFT